MTDTDILYMAAQEKRITDLENENRELKRLNDEYIRRVEAEQPVVDTENMATVSDEFICKKCGIHIKDYIKVVMDEDNDGYIDEQHYEYEPKFCPECGAKVKED